MDGRTDEFIHLGLYQLGLCRLRLLELSFMSTNCTGDLYTISHTTTCLSARQCTLAKTAAEIAYLIRATRARKCVSQLQCYVDEIFHGLEDVDQ